MKPLILSGRVLAGDLASVGAKRQSGGFRSPASFPAGDRDAALIAHHDDWELAHARGYKLAIGRDERPAQASLGSSAYPLNSPSLAMATCCVSNENRPGAGALPPVLETQLLPRDGALQQLLLDVFAAAEVSR